MGSWWQSQLNFAEGLLDQVDKKVSSAVGQNEHHPQARASVEAASQNVTSHTPQRSLSPEHGVIRSSPVPLKSPARVRASPGSVKLPSKKTRATSASTAVSSRAEESSMPVPDKFGTGLKSAPMSSTITERLHADEDHSTGTPGSPYRGWTTPVEPHLATPKTTQSAPVVRQGDVLTGDGQLGGATQPRSPASKATVQTNESSTPKGAAFNSRFPAIPPPPPPVQLGKQATPSELPETASPVSRSPLTGGAPALAPAISPTAAQAHWSPKSTKTATATPAAAEQDTAEAVRDPGTSWSAVSQPDQPGQAHTSNSPTQADAELRASRWSSAPQTSDAVPAEQDVRTETSGPGGPPSGEGGASVGSGGSIGGSSGAMNGGAASAGEPSNGAEAGGVLVSGTTTADASAELAEAPATVAAGATRDADAGDSAGAIQVLREELTTAQGRSAVAETALAEARDNADAAEARAAAAEGRADAASAAAAEAQSALADAQERAKAAMDSASAARSKAREAMERAGLKADQLRSCEARLGQLEAEVEAATAAQQAAENEVARLQAEAGRAAEAAAQEGHEYVDTLQRELTAVRETAEAAQRDAAAERAAAGEARAAAARRQEHLEASLGSAHAEAANCARAAEEASEALEAAEGRVAALEQRLVAVESGKAAFAAAETDRVAELQAALEAAEARYTAAQRVATDSKNQVDTLEQAALERANSGAHIAIQELQQQLNQANHLLVERQSQWEHSGAERGARILTLERQLAHVEEKLAAAQRQAAAESSARGHSLMMADEVVPLASLGGYHRIASNRRFGGAVKAFGGTVDRVTAQAVALLRRHPAARLLVLLYIATVHLFIYVLLGRMQHSHLQASTGIPTHTSSLRAGGTAGL